MKAWLLLLTLTTYDANSAYPVSTIMRGPLLPILENCMQIRQMISEDLNRLEDGSSVYVECKELP